MPLEKVYSFDPVPKELSADEAKYILGAQANIWTEYLKTPERVEYMAFPREIALSEVAWSRAEDKNFADFERRLSAHYARLDKQNVNYRIPEPAGLQNAVLSESATSITLANKLPGAKIYYTLDGSVPDETKTLYDRPVEVSLKAGQPTELKTIVVGPNGRKSSIYAATLWWGAMLRSIEEMPHRAPGLNFSFLVPAADPMAKPAVETGTTRGIGLQQFAQKKDLKQPFVVSYDGYIFVPSDGIYEFQIDSTWDTTLVLGQSDMIINDAGTKDRKVRSAVVPLKAGFHKISIRYNHRGGEAAFRFRWGIKGQGLRGLETRDMFH